MEHVKYLAAVYCPKTIRLWKSRLRRVLFLTWQEDRLNKCGDGVSVLRNGGAEFGWGLSVLGRGVAWCAPTDKHWSQLHVEAKRFPSWADHGLLTPGRLLERWQYNRKINTSSTFMLPLGIHSIFSSVIHQTRRFRIDNEAANYSGSLTHYFSDDTKLDDGKDQVINVSQLRGSLSRESDPSIDLQSDKFENHWPGKRRISSQGLYHRTKSKGGKERKREREKIHFVSSQYLS